jgi:hypothetical protein
VDLFPILQSAVATSIELITINGKNSDAELIGVLDFTRVGKVLQVLTDCQQRLEKSADGMNKAVCHSLERLFVEVSFHHPLRRFSFVEKIACKNRPVSSFMD